MEVRHKCEHKPKIYVYLCTVIEIKRKRVKITQ